MNSETNTRQLAGNNNPGGLIIAWLSLFPLLFWQALWTWCWAGNRLVAIASCCISSGIHCLCFCRTAFNLNTNQIGFKEQTPSEAARCVCVCACVLQTNRSKTNANSTSTLTAKGTAVVIRISHHCNRQAPHNYEIPLSQSVLLPNAEQSAAANRKSALWFSAVIWDYGRKIK